MRKRGIEIYEWHCRDPRMCAIGSITIQANALRLPEVSCCRPPGLGRRDRISSVARVHSPFQPPWSLARASKPLFLKVFSHLLLPAPVVLRLKRGPSLAGLLLPWIPIRWAWVCSWVVLGALFEEGCKSTSGWIGSVQGN